MGERVAVLLGAGASADAGLPLTTELAEMLVRNANAVGGDLGPLPDWVRALNFVYGSMVGYQAEDGSNPLQAVNIERLISALRLLQDAKVHEVAPFVAAWKAGALGVGTPHIDRGLGERAMSAISGSLGSRFSEGQRFADAIAAIAKSATSTPSPHAFKKAEDHLLGDLSELLGGVNDTAYLRPLAELAKRQPGGLDVLTLNYDLTVELMAQATSTPIDRGIGSWEPGNAIERTHEDGKINLHKLHGSLDWELEPPGHALEPPKILSPERTEETDADGDGILHFNRRRRPWIVVGDREKLATDGPTLDLLQSATVALRQASHLVIVGYSFSDIHINAMIRDWMAADDARTIGVLDLTWQVPHQDGFRGALVRAFGDFHRERRDSRIVPVAGTAAAALERALTARPAQSGPEPYADAEYSVETDHVAMRVTLLGPDLYGASISIHHQATQTDGRRVLARGFDTFRSRDELDARDKTIPSRSNSYRPVNLDVWRQGETITLFSDVPPPGGITSFQVWGRRLDGVDDVAESILLNLDEVSPPTQT